MITLINTIIEKTKFELCLSFLSLPSPSRKLFHRVSNLLLTGWTTTVALSPSNPSASRHINNRLSVYVFLDSEPQLGKSKQIITKWKHESREFLIAVLFGHQKKKGSAWNFLQPPIQVCSRCFNPLFQNQRHPVLLPHLFHNIQDQQNGKRTYCWLPSSSFRSDLNYTSFQIFLVASGLYLTLEHLLSFRTWEMTIEFGQLIECNMRKIFLKKSYTKCGGETCARPSSEKLKLSISLDQ